MPATGPRPTRCRHDYQEHGFAIVRQLLDHDRVAALGAIVEAVFRQWLGEHWSDVPGDAGASTGSGADSYFFAASDLSSAASFLASATSLFPFVSALATFSSP